MIKDKIHNLLLGNRFYGIEILSVEEVYDFYVIEVLKEKTNLTITEKFHFKNFTSLINRLDTNIPIVLNFSGENIITKETTNEEGYRSKILFTNNEDDFYWYELRNKQSVYASIARKENINKTIEEFKINNFTIIDFSLGSLVIQSIKTLLPNEDIIFSNNQSLSFQNENLEKINTVESNETVSYKIGEEIIRNQHIVSFASIVNYFYPNTLLDYSKEVFSHNTEELKYRKAIKLIGFSALGFFLVSLLISFFTLDYFQNKQQQVLIELNTQNSAYKKLVDLENDKKNKEAILKESGIQNNHFISYYVNQLVKDIPNKIVLEQLDVFPVSKKIKQNQLIDFQRNKIIITGNVNDNQVLNNWVQDLKNLKWITNIEISDYHKVKSNNSFTLKLSIN